LCGFGLLRLMRGESGFVGGHAFGSARPKFGFFFVGGGFGFGVARPSIDSADIGFAKLAKVCLRGAHVRWFLFIADYPLPILNIAD
jgi:hypothetical protein